jgi:hypothetical protein
MVSAASGLAKNPDAASGLEQPAEPQPGTGRFRAFNRRNPLIWCALAIAVLLAGAVAARSPQRGFLDPAAVDPPGSRAVVNLLRDQGVAVRTAATLAEVEAFLRAGPDTAVFVRQPERLSATMSQRLVAAKPAQIVVAGAEESPLLARIAAGVKVANGRSLPVAAPGCLSDVPANAGAAQLGDLSYDARAWPASVACYGTPEAAQLVDLPADPTARRPRVTLLGSARPLTNSGLAKQGNAALALGLLGAHQTLVWWSPTIADPALADSADARLLELLPPWVGPVAWALVFLVGWLAWWRSRRFGPLVTEPLPVAVPAAETTMGRGRLLMASAGRDVAAEHLRAGARSQLALRLGIRVSPLDPDALAAAVQSSLASKTPSAEGAALFGPAPRTDAELLELAATLDQLILEVRRNA